ncbi:peptidase M23 [Paracoccus suum]|uniref:Peptidase M23 n=1 Tax=Paracoccus suum TaxID=2259340 RepID=A0A344PGL6_9RHOB|nr:peptidoglycan DD-metalloendopeptidase family protein [Paracoccus suum]AXC48521.1 peptidase M23 [Paracoccus suum]
MIRRSLAICAALLVGTPVLAATTPADGAAAEAGAAASALRAATGKLDQALSADDQVVALSEVIRAYEQGQAALRQGLRRASAREDQIRDGFDARRGELSRMLAVMADLGRAPEATLLLHPRGPEATARAGMVMASVAPALRAEADGLRTDLDEIATIRKAQENAAETLASGLGRVQEARRLLASAVTDRSTLPKRFLDDPDELKQLAASAESLDAFAKGVAALEADVGPPLSDFEGAQGGLPLPAIGQVLRGYNKPDRAGVRRPGLVLATAPRALVTTPWAATIRYRGPLLDYGNVMILEPARGYLLVLAGMAQVFGETGDVLTAGEPVGLMGGDEGTGPEFGINFVVDAAHGTNATSGESLYIELRKDKNTLDPADWFVTDPAVVAQVAAAGANGEETTEEGSDSGQDGPVAAEDTTTDATAVGGAEDNGTDE